MQDYVLRVGEELVIPGHVRLTILAVEEDRVTLGVTDEPDGVRGPVGRKRRSELEVVPVPLLDDN
ncbi:MAG TPA: hypothetical protein VH643_22835 [Gemmataceae bacterium]|jgi:hypothetical protein